MTYNDLPTYVEFGLPERTPEGHYAKYIVGPKGGSGKRIYICHECRLEVDSDSAKHRPTLHAIISAYEHVTKFHQDKLDNNPGI